MRQFQIRIERNVTTTFYRKGRGMEYTILKINRSKTPESAAVRVLVNMQLEKYPTANVAEVYDGITGKLYIVVKKFERRIEILYKDI